MPPSRLDALDDVFRRLAGHDGVLDPGELQALLEIRDPLFARQVFAALDADRSGHVDLREFRNRLTLLCGGSEDAKLRFAFTLHDHDDDGRIDEAELLAMVRAGLNENALAFSDEQVATLVRHVYHALDADGRNGISYAEFAAGFGRYPDLLSGMTVSPAAWLLPHVAPPPASRPAVPSAAIRHLRAHAARYGWLLLYLAANIALFAQAMQHYRDLGANEWVQAARGFGAMVNLNGALILLPMLRSWLDRLRATRGARWLPLDDARDAHQLIGHVMFAAACLHTIAHLGNYASLPVPWTQSLLATFAGASGLLLLAVFATMWATALRRIRLGGHFRLFYFAHLGYMAWFVLLLAHGAHFWKWAAIPLLLFAWEKLRRRRHATTPAEVTGARLLPSRVLELEVRRPGAFAFQPGDYLYLRCPAVSRHEWHPFSISSHPERKDALTLHIRSVGSWTGALRECFQAGAAQGGAPMPVHLDGAFATPSRDVLQASHAVVVAAGIGVTPFASLLQSIEHRRRAGDPSLRLRKLHFVWVNRDQAAFEWFVRLLAQLEAEDHDGFFAFHIYLTGARCEADLKSGMLHIALDLLHDQTQADLVTGLRTRTHTGRPDWDHLLAGIAGQHPGERVDVFYCGPSGASHALRRASSRHGFGYREERFG